MLKIRLARSRQFGLSLVELMVGITVGLFVVAAASLLMSTQLSENRRLLTETQLQQDLRTTADVIVREARRAGYTGEAEKSVANVLMAEPVLNSRYGKLDLTAGQSGSITYDYKRPDNAPGPYGYKLEAGVIKSNLPNAGWQELTDKNILAVDAFTISLKSSTPIVLACAKDCPPAGVGQSADWCWPTLTVRDLTITITGHSVIDPAVTRTVLSRVRLRNDLLQFRAQDPSSPKACPA